MMDVVRFLCEQAAARVAGSGEEERIISFLEFRLVEQGLDVHREPFAFRGWEAADGCRLEVASDSKQTVMDGEPFPYTMLGGEVDHEGLLRWEGEYPVIPGRLTCPRFIIEDDRLQPVAAVLGSPAGAARPLPNPNPLLALPTMVIGAEDMSRLQDIVAADGRSRARIVGGGAQERMRAGTNLVADGQGTERCIAVVAHYDCVPGSPGANDNASGVSLLLRLAKRFSTGVTPRTGLRFVLFGAEEPFLAGSRSYVASATATGRLAACRAALNLDMVGFGERIAVRRVSGSIWERAANRLPQSSRLGSPIVQTDLHPASDHWAFHEAGIPSAQLTREPDPAWHSPDDRLERFDDHQLDEAEDVAAALIADTARQLDEAIN